MIRSGPTVLIDGDVGRLRRGSGLSTYARTLSTILESLGMRAGSLIGSPAPKRGDELLDAVSAADTQPSTSGVRQRTETLFRMVDGLSSPVARARRLPDLAVSLNPTEWNGLGPDYLAPNLFRNAHYRHMFLRQFTEVHTTDPVDILHLTSPLPIQMRNVKTVTTIHDLIPIRLPQTTTDNKAEYVSRVRTSVKNSDLIVTVSEFSKREIVEILNVDPEKVVVTYQPPTIAPLTEDENSTLASRLFKYGLDKDGYLLFVGAIEPKKNVRRLIEAYLEVDTACPLVLAGPMAWLWKEEIGDLDTVLGDAARRRIRILGYVSRADLRWLYAGARGFAFPSLFEGYGLPPLDALNMGVPTLVSNTSSLPEVCGDAALYVDPYDRSAITAGLERILEDQDLRDKLRCEGPRQASLRSLSDYREALARTYACLA
ncbi:MAG: glycosyltransferase family 4 protein [Alphaproteobacteria bacterium]|nr:glycosyltransferase family 4 protein [Alphaproteobacteria bacterium]